MTGSGRGAGPAGHSGGYGGDPWRPWHAREALDALLADLSAPPSDALEAIFGRWHEIVGADLAEHCKPVSVQGELLTVAATDPAWASELRWLEKEILARVGDATGSKRITRLRVRAERM